MADIFVAKHKNTDISSTDKETPPQDLLSQAVKIANPIINFKTPLHIFASYAKTPKDVTFEHQDPGEEVLLFARQDFITNSPWILITVILTLLPILFPILFPQFGIFSILPPVYNFFIAIFYYLIVVTYFFVNFITWFFNISIVTNIRVMDVDVSNLVYKNVASTKINLIQDVSFTQTGVLRTIFDYGDVIIQTAGTLVHFDFHRVPRPDDIVNLIDDLIGKGKHV